MQRGVKRLFYASAGPGDMIAAHRFWQDGVADPEIVSVTFSSQIAEFCEARGFKCLMICPQGDGQKFDDGNFAIEHWRKSPKSGVSYHLEQIWYGLRLLAKALKFRADYAVLDLNCTHAFMMSLFRLFGIKVVVVLHTTLWPVVSGSRSRVDTFLLSIDKMLFWKFAPNGVIGMSDECIRQVQALVPHAKFRTQRALAQFNPDYFAATAPVDAGTRPLQILFVGRAEQSKGVLDLPLIAARVEARRPGSAFWTVCGDGADLARLKKILKREGVESLFNVAGWTKPRELIGFLGKSHVVIVPTRAEAGEGMAMTAIEAICAGRPVITSSAVPAIDLLRPACVEARPNDVESYADAVIRLATEPEYYETLRAACAPLSAPFFDRRLGLQAALDAVID